jgi:hypothetical protein
MSKSNGAFTIAFFFSIILRGLMKKRVLFFWER